MALACAADLREPNGFGWPGADANGEGNRKQRHLHAPLQVAISQQIQDSCFQLRKHGHILSIR
jgi:hypothetical protein